MGSAALLRRVAAASPTSKFLNRGAVDAYRTNAASSPSPKATFINLLHYSNSTALATVPKILLEVNGKLMPIIEPGSPRMYQMSVLADSEQEAIEAVHNFVALVRSNDPVTLSTYASSKVSLTEVKESISMAAREVQKQAMEHCADIKSEVHVLKAAVASYNEGLKELSEDVTSNKETLNTILATVGRVEEEAKRFTLLKFLAYASGMTLINGGITWLLGEHQMNKVKEFSQRQMEKIKDISFSPSEKTITELPGP